MAAFQGTSKRAAGAGAAILALSLLATACGRGDTLVSSSACTYTYECAVGEICKSGVCVAASDQIPVGEGGAGGEGGGGSGGTAGAGGSGGAGGAGGAGGSGGVGPLEPRVTFAPNDYRRCYDSLECAVFGGNCIVELPLSRPQADGTERILLSEIDTTLKKGQGICGVACTNEPRICDSFTVTGPEGQSKPSTCQLVFVGDSPYPEGATQFPFPIDALAMARGVPFASICRPPFEYAPAHSPSFCQPCTEPAHCAEGDVCWLDRAFTGTPSGSCVQTCELQKDCPFGFRCTDVTSDDPFLVGEGGSYCLPVAGTCGRCLDRDGDQRGVGTCGPLDEPFTEVDCDDSNPEAYFDPSRPTHPFPRFCGEFDFNCNGLSDRAEQEGSEDHCAFCGNLCVGPVEHGERSCAPSDDGGHACIAICEPGFADCNGDADDGCETELLDGMLWFRDRDGDGRGNPKERRYFCGGSAPAGWVQNPFDCDDANPARYGGGADESGVTIAAAPEICDGIDNDCNGLVDDGTVVELDATGAVVATAGEACDTGLHGVCAEGHFACEPAIDPADGAPLAAMRCVPDRNPSVAVRSPEVCNGQDDNCNGQVDEGVDWFVEQGQSNPNGPDAPATCVVPGGKGICAFGVMQCVAADDGTAAWGCVPNLPKSTDPIGDGLDENCDGIDGDLETSIFVRPVAGGGTLNGNDANLGKAQSPVATLGRAIALACSGIAPGQSCRDIYVEKGFYTSATQLDVPTSPSPGDQPYVRIYGGFQATVSCEGACRLTWDRPAGQVSTFVREPPAPNDGRFEGNERMPFGKRYAAIGAGAGTGPMELVLDRMSVVVLGPDPAYQMPNGSSAPTQVALECPARGCGRLVLGDVSIEVEDAINGAVGDAGQGGAIPEGTNDGINGCVAGENCAVSPWLLPFPPSNGELWFMSYGLCTDGRLPPAALNDYRKNVPQCADGRTPFGGSSGAVRCYSSDLTLWYYTIGWAGGGYGAGAGGSAASRGHRGSNGPVGSGGRYVTAGSTLGWTGGPSPAWSYQSATSGTSGGGGGGAGGCLKAPGYKSTYLGCNQNHRGAGGGAGGCNGTGGARGGHGGSAVGILLVPPASGGLKLETKGSFQVSTGRGGNGGGGGAGGPGAPGGWGGLGRKDSEDISFAGGEGGDGGGGGGGGGGLGGASVGMWRLCTRPGGSLANGCSMDLPPMLLASPDLFVLPGQGGKGGAGGNGGKRGEKGFHMQQRTDGGAAQAAGGTGATGPDGQRIFLHFSGGQA